jgi:hypothetical protein
METGKFLLEPEVNSSFQFLVPSYLCPANLRIESAWARLYEAGPAANRKELLSEQAPEGISISPWIAMRTCT